MSVILPSGQNVTGTIDPGMASDPGLSVSPQQFGAQLGPATEELGGAFDVMAQVADRQSSRQESINTARARSQYNEAVRKQLDAIESTGDLSDDKAMAEFGAYMEQQRQELLKNFSGREGARQDLERLLIAQGDVFAGQASARAVEAADAHLFGALEQETQPLLQQVRRNPEDLADAFTQLDLTMDLYSPGLSPKQDIDTRAALNNRLVSSTFEGQLLRGDSDGAGTTLDLYGDRMTPGAYARSADRLAQFEFSQDKEMRKIAGMRAAGVEPTANDIRAIYGGSPVSASAAKPEVVIDEAGVPRYFAPGTAIHGQQAPEKTPLIAAGETRAAQNFADRATTEIPVEIRSKEQEAIIVNQMLSLLNAGGTVTGDIPGALLTYVQDTFGFDIGTPDGRQAFNALSANQALAQVSNLKGNLSDKDVVFLFSSIAHGGRSTTSNIALLELRKFLLEKDTERLQLERRYWEENDSLKGFEDFITKAMPPDANPLPAQLLDNLARDSLSTEQLTALPQQLSGMLVGSVKLTRDVLEQSIQGMKQEELNGMPATFLMWLQRKLEEAPAGKKVS